MKKTIWFLVAIFLAPLITKADGGFVVQKFVWDKYKDINEPTQKAIIVYDAGREDLILQVKYEGPVNQFGWIIPVPNLPTVRNGSMKCFYELSQFSQEHFGDGEGVMGTASAASNSHQPPPPPPPVKVVEIKTVGDYKIAILAARDSGALKRWLDDNQFYIPPDKSGVLDSYVGRQWYFVAVKISLRKWFSGSSISKKLASGELNPLQISFASDRCVFPLKISSINGKPSEVQVYVLSPEPLLEPGMLQKSLPGIYNNDVQRAVSGAQWENARIEKGIAHSMALYGGVPPDIEQEQISQRWHNRPCPSPEELLQYTRIAKTDLPDCRHWIPQLAGKSWWLTKQTWTFQPDEMRDLTFEPAWPAFSMMLGSKYGGYAAASLGSFGSNGVPLLLAAMQSPNPAVRTNAATAFNLVKNWANTEDTFKDPRVQNAAQAWLNDPEPSVRMAGLYMLTSPAKMGGKLSAPLLLQLLKDPDPTVRGAAVFNASDYENDTIPDEVILALLNNPGADARMAGVIVLFRNKNKQSVELALPMLKDPNMFVRQTVGSTLRALTGQDFSDDQIDNWYAWWNQAKDNFTVQLRPGQFGLHPANALASLRSTNMEVAVAAYAQLTRQQRTLTSDQALALLENPMPVARMYGLDALSEKLEPQSVIIAISFLKDPDKKVRLRASQVLWVLTGQPCTADHPDDWIKWWNQNPNSVGQPHSKNWIWPDGQAYLEQGSEYYDQSNFVEALADFQQACELNPNDLDVQDFSHYRVWLIRARSGEKEAATRELVTYLEHRKPDIPPFIERRFPDDEVRKRVLAAYENERKAENPLDWPLPLGRFLAGQITEADLLKAAAVNAPQVDGVRYCEAYFYAGAKRLIENDRTGAVKLFKKCLDTGMTELYEYHSATAELNALN